MCVPVRFGKLTGFRCGPHPAQAKTLPLVFIHGLWADGSIFKPRWLHSAGSKGIAAYAVNLRGRADSFPTDVGGVSTEDFVADVRGFMDSVGDCFLLGHSAGGLIAQKTAERDPRVKGLVLVATAPPRGILPRGQIWLRAWRAEYLWAAICKKPFKIKYRDTLVLVLNRLGPTEQWETYGRFVPDSGLAAREMGFLGVEVLSAKVQCPVLVMGGRLDEMMPVSVARAVKEKYPRALYREYECAHLPMLEAGWEEPLYDLVRFVQDYGALRR